MEEEELPATTTEIPSVSDADNVDCSENEKPQLTVLKPLSYDVGELPNDKSDLFNKMDIDNHNVDIDAADTKNETPPLNEDVATHAEEVPITPAGATKDITDSGNVPESAVKVNGVMSYQSDTDQCDANKKTPDSSPNNTPGKSRYGRIRKPKLSTDFVSVDRKSFAVLNNTSSYEHVYADETPHKIPGKRKTKRSYRRRSNVLLIRDQPSETDVTETKELTEKASYITQSLSADDDSKDPPPTTSTEETAANDLTESSKDAPISPLNCKDTIKTYSRKGEPSSSAGSEEKSPDNDDETHEKISPINHHELNWKVGDVAWAKIGCYPYWPSIVTLEYGSSIYVKPVGSRRLAVHVQFFGDRGRRSWVLTTSLIKYQSKEQFLELKQKYKKDKIRFKYYMIKQSFQDLWEKAITEADTVLKLPHEERIPYYQSLYPVSEEVYATEMSTVKAKPTFIRPKKNPEERRGRKRKILDETLNSTTLPAKKKPRSVDTEATTSEATETLPSSGDEKEKPIKKSRKPIDEHTKKRRAFMRRMNKILKQSNNNDLPLKKRLHNGLKSKRAENAKFNRLLNKGVTKKPSTAQTGGGTTEGEGKRKDISVYDFESDEETDIFIGTYNSRFTPQILAKIEQEKVDKSTNDENTKPSSDTGEGKSNIKSEIDDVARGRKLFDEEKPKTHSTDHVLPKGTASKFSKLFERRKGGGKGKGNVRASHSGIKRAKQTKNAMAKRFRDKMRANDDNKSDKEAVIRKRLGEKVKKGEYEVFKEKTVETVTAEHPEFTTEEIENHLKNMWNELDDKEKFKYTRVPTKTEEIESTSDDDDLKSSGNENEADDKRRSSSPSFLPTKPKKLLNMFAGYKNEKVCQICEKPGNTVRCRGPCCGHYHVECVQKAAAKNSPEAKKTPGRRGRPRKSATPSIATESNQTPTKTKPKKENVEKMEVDRAVTRSADTSMTEDVKEASTSEQMGDKSNPTEGKSDKAKFVKPTLRRSRRVLEENVRLKDDKKTDNIADCKPNEENEDRKEPGNDDQMEVDVEPEIKLEKETECENDDDLELKSIQLEDMVKKNKATIVEDDPAAEKAEKSSSEIDNESVTEEVKDDDKSETANETEPSAIQKIKEEATLKDEKEQASGSGTEMDEKEDSVAQKDEKKQPSDTQIDEKEGSAVEKEEKEANATAVEKEEKEANATQKNETEITAATESDKPDDKDDGAEESGKSESPDSLDNDDAAASDVSENLSGSTKTDSSNGIDFKCNFCTEGLMYPCLTCGKDKEEKTGDTERYSCYIASCGRVYHKECLKSWPQATWGVNSGKSKGNGSGAVTPKETLMCPQHYCHTCISDNPAVLKTRLNRDKLVKCIRCPTTYHQSMHCIPAGSELLTMTQIICPRHYEPPKMKSTHVNTSWCFICCIGGSLICCEECPTSFHAECLKLSPEEYAGRYICDDCQTGRYLLYGEVVWVKLGHYRWWPARVLYPQEIPDNIAHLPHRRGEFVVRFFGSHDYNWVNRGRAFLYQEGDSGRKNCSRTNVDLTFDKALIEAEEAHIKLKSDKALRDEEAKVGMKPPRYVRIKANRPVGNVRIVETSPSNIPDCKCDPSSERPCAPESDCLNRMLLVECNPRVCTAGERCLNRAFEKRQYPPLVPYRTDKRGWGLKTLVDIKKGDFIIEYVGEMIDEEEYKRRVSHMYRNQEDNYYFLTIDKDRMLDAGPKGNVSRFMNHSCDPNCETQKWTVNGDTRVGLFALKDITANDELVFNYNLSTLGNEMKPCLCGSEKCSGFIGVKATKNGNNGNGSEEEGRKKSGEENRKRSLDDQKASTSATQRRKKITKKMAAKKLQNKTKRLSAKNKKKLSQQKGQEEKPGETKDEPETTDKNDETPKERDPTTDTAEADQKVEVDTDKKPKTPKIQDEKTPPKEEKEEKSADQVSTTEKNGETKSDEPLQSTSKDETQEKEGTCEGDKAAISKVAEPEVEKQPSSKSQNKVSPSRRQKALFDKRRKIIPKQSKEIKKKAKPRRKKKTVLMKRKVKLLQKRGKKVPVPPKKRKIVKTVVTPKKEPTSTPGKRGRKPHLTEEDREKALFKSLIKRKQRKLKGMVGISKLDEKCYVCSGDGELIFCDNKKCPRGYHITCVKKFKFPKGRWLCPWHYCNECNGKCKVAKCSQCVNSFCTMHVEENIFVRSDNSYICKDHKAEYLDARLLSSSMLLERTNASTDEDSLLNVTASTIEQIDNETLLFPLKFKKTPSSAKRKTQMSKLTKKLNPPIKIKQESLSDIEIEEPVKKPVYVGESRNVAKRSKKLDISKKLPENTTPITSMEIDEYIEVHHVEVTGSDRNSVAALETDDADSEYGECSQNRTEFNVSNTAEISDDEYVDVEMEEINDDSS